MVTRFKEFLEEEVSIEAELNEGYAKGGFDFEKQIVNHLKKHGLMHKHVEAAGSSGDAPDGHLNIGGHQHSLEIKKNKSAMMGQLELHHHPTKGWHVSERAKAKYPRTAEHIEKSGFLDKVNSQWGKPSGNYEKDLKMGNVYHTEQGTKAIAAHYHHDRDTPYMHIGGKGTFHLHKDTAGVGSTKLTGNTQLRARMKYRGTDKKTGKKKYGALIVMSLKEPNHSDLNLENSEHIKAIAKEAK
ncbi:hypothetical protein OAU13_00530 [bacterium]|nr:hypothetical protein [bacterium]